jgi:RNA polymerase sigma-70 factor (ECF subfamily)
LTLLLTPKAPRPTGGGVLEAEGGRRLSLPSPGANLKTLLRGPTKRTDEDLEKAWRSGSRAAFADLFRRHYAGVVAYAKRYTGDLALAEDITQHAFMNVFQRKRGAGRFKSLIYTVTRNLALNERRRQGRKYVAKGGLEVEPPGRPEQPLGGIVRREEEQGLADALAALPDELREAFCLKETRGLTYAEVGKIMGLHPDAVRRRVGKALAQIREKLKSESLL